MIRILVLLAALGAAVAPFAVQAAEDRVVEFDGSDAEMNAAIARARASLPAFWTAFAAQTPGTADFSLKVKIADGGYTEHFWTSDISRDGDTITAVIANDPEVVKTVALGQRVAIPQADISDWMFYRHDKIVGGETVRIILKQLAPEEAAAMGLEFETP